MTYDTLVSTSGIPKPLILAALYNVAPRPRDGADEFMVTMNRQGAEALLDRELDLRSPLFGRRVPVDLTDDNWIDSAEFDAIYGAGMTRLVVESLRVTGNPENQTTEFLSDVVAGRTQGDHPEPIASDIVALFDASAADIGLLIERCRQDADAATRVNALVTCASLALARAELMRKHLLTDSAGEIQGMDGYEGWSEIANRCVDLLGRIPPHGVIEQLRERSAALESHVAILRAVNRISGAAGHGAEPPAL